MLHLRRTTWCSRAGWTLLALLVLVGCFSTIRPEVDDPSPDPIDDPNTAVVRGLTMHKFATGDIRRRSDWSVEVRWFGNGEEVRRHVIKSDNNAVYEAVTTDRRVTSVRVRPLLCSFDPNDPRNECCLESTCECPAVWGSWRILEVKLGVYHNEINLVVNCR